MNSFAHFNYFRIKYNGKRIKKTEIREKKNSLETDAIESK